MTDDELKKLDQLRRESELSKKIGWAVFGGLFIGGIYLGFGITWAVGVGGLWVAQWYLKYWPRVTWGDPTPTVLALVCGVLSVTKCSSAVDTGAKLSYIEKACEGELARKEDDFNHVCAKIISKIHEPGILGTSSDEDREYDLR